MSIVFWSLFVKYKTCYTITHTTRFGMQSLCIFFSIPLCMLFQPYPCDAVVFVHVNAFDSNRLLFGRFSILCGVIYNIFVVF